MATAKLLLLTILSVIHSVLMQSDPNCWEVILEGGTVDCSNSQLTEVPNGLPENTRILKLDGNSIQQIHAEAFVGLDSLEELLLNDNEIQAFSSQSICRLPKLSQLKLAKNQLTSLPDLSECQYLEELNVANNKISQLRSTQLSNMSRLKKLDLSRNNLTSIDENTLPKNTNLRLLILTANSIKSIETDAFLSTPKLEKIRLSRNKITELPDRAFANLDELVFLDMSKNLLTDIQHLYFAGLFKLRELNLERNKVEILSDGSFFQCEELQKLNLGSNFLTDVAPGPWFGLKKLTHLILANNAIESMPNTFTSWAGQTTNVEVLDLSRNKLTVIAQHYFKHATNLKVLDLSRNDISQINPGSFNEMSNLEYLNLSRNELSDSLQLSSKRVFSGLNSLLELDLKENSLREISRYLVQGLPSLTTLKLGGNPVTSIEREALSSSVLPHFTTLEMSTDKLVCDCQIAWLPEWLIQSSGMEVSAKCALPEKNRNKDVLDVPKEDFVCGLVTPKPIITRNLRNTTVLQGANITLSCTATTSNGNSNVRVEWRKNSKIIQPDSGLIDTDDTTSGVGVSMHTTYLHLTKVGAEDVGSYQCGFSNDFGSDYSETAHLRVLVFPSFVTTPSDKTVKAGREVRLLCEATGFPQPFLSWNKDGGNFPAARERRFEVNPDNVNEFIIKDVEWEDHGTYYCNATNDAGYIISNATLSVQAPPILTETISCESNDDGTYKLECQHDGNPKYAIKWYKDGHEINQSDKFSGEYHSVFTVDESPENAGIYMCVAINAFGMVNSTCNVQFNDEIAPPIGSTEHSSKKPAALDKNTITGLIVIAVVCCVVGTSLVWVVIIYQTRRRRGDNSSNNTEEIIVPLNGGPAIGHKFNNGPQDSVSSDSSNPSKSDSFLEYHSSSQGSPRLFGTKSGRGRTAVYTDATDPESQAAMEPLTNNSEDSLSDYYSGTTSAQSGVHFNQGMPQSMSNYYVSEQLHPFSTFQPSRQHRCRQNAQRSRAPVHSVSAEYIPYIDKSQPPDLAQLLHQFKAPSTRPPDYHTTPLATVAPVPAQSDSTHAKPQQFEEPGYMNLPKSAITPTAEQLPKLEAKPHSEYMNLTPEDIHIYQNSHDLIMKAQERQRQTLQSTNCDTDTNEPHHQSAEDLAQSYSNSASESTSKCTSPKQCGPTDQMDSCSGKSSRREGLSELPSSSAQREQHFSQDEDFHRPHSES